MENNVELVRRLYISFNTRNIDQVLVELTEDVTWANGMEGGKVVGHAALREYWTLQWSMVSAHVEPIDIAMSGQNAIIARVKQTVRDLMGNSLQAQSHGLSDRTVIHIFQFRDGKVCSFEIGEG